MTATRNSGTLVRALLPHHWRLSTRLTAAMVVVLGLLLGFSFITYGQLLRQRRGDELGNATAITGTVAAQIDGFLRDIESTTLAIAQGLAIQDVPLTQRTVGTPLRNVQESYGILRALFVVDLRGRVVASASGEGIGLDLSGRPYMEALRSGATSVWSGGVRGFQSGQVTIAFGRPIEGAAGRPHAYLVAAFYPPDLMLRLRQTLPQDSRITLIDRQGFVLFTSVDSNLPLSQRDLSSHPNVREALAGEVVRVLGAGVPSTGEPRYGALVPIRATGWVVAFTRPLAPLEHDLRVIALRQAGGAAVAVLLAGFIFLMITRRVIRPLEGLAASADAIARGERPSLPEVKGPVEVVQLTAGMRAMSQAVADREDTLRFLGEASRELSSSLDDEAILRNLSHLAVPRMADWCVIYLVHEDGTVRRLEIAHADPAKLALVRRFAGQDSSDPRHPHPVLQAIATGKPQLMTEIPEAVLRGAARSEEQYQLVQELGFKSAMIVPIIMRGQAMGAIAFASAESGRRYEQADLVVAEGLAHRTALAVTNARMYAHQRSIAETLQRSLLRKELPQLPAMSVAARYLPARPGVEVGGDWYDVFLLPDTRIGMVMGDVAGRGLEAASVMGEIQHALRAYALEGHPPGVVLSRLNRLLELKEMATVLYLVFDPDSWSVRFANAGHLPPLVISPVGQAALLEGGAPPLGSSPLTVYGEHVAAIAPGATIILFTDGLVEVRGESLDAGLARLVAAASTHARDDLEMLLDRLLSQVGSDSPADDVALLAVRAAPLNPASLALRLPAAPGSLPVLRHTLGRWLAQAGAGESDIYEISVACAEAYTNSIEHAYRAADAQVEIEANLVDGEVDITIHDRGKWREPRGEHRGRGLALMRGLMEDVQVARTDQGTTVHMRRRLRREART